MGGFFRFLSIALAIVCGIVGLIMGLGIIAEIFGGFWTVVSFFLFPIPIFISPWIAIFRDGDWTLFLINYGGAVACWILNLISVVLSSTLRS